MPRPDTYSGNVVMTCEAIMFIIGMWAGWHIGYPGDIAKTSVLIALGLIAMIVYRRQRGRG